MKLALPADLERSIENRPRVSVIIVNWNGKEYLPECLDSLRDQTYHDFEAVVVDNGSHDGSVDLLRKSYPWVRLVLLETNSGFAGGNNAGLAAADAGAYIVTLNNDTRVDRRWLEELTAAAEGSPQVGMVASRICAWDNPDQIDSLGLDICTDGMSRGSRRGASFSALSLGKSEDVLLPSACAALYRREMIDETGFFDDDYWLAGTSCGVEGRACPRRGGVSPLFRKRWCVLSPETVPRGAEPFLGCAEMFARNCAAGPAILDDGSLLGAGSTGSGVTRGRSPVSQLFNR
jgi:hypothetical protein